MSESEQPRPGVHEIADDEQNVLGEVACALKDRLDKNIGSTIYVKAGQLRREHELSIVGQKVNAALRELADGEDWKFGLSVERTNPNANRRRWTVQREPLEGDR